MYSDYAYSELFYLLYGEKIWHLKFFRFFFQLVMRWLGRWLQRWKDGTKTDNGICRNLVTLKMVTPKLLGTRLHRTQPFCGVQHFFLIFFDFFWNSFFLIFFWNFFWTFFFEIFFFKFFFLNFFLKFFFLIFFFWN